MNTQAWLARQSEKRDSAELRTLGTALQRPELLDLIVSRVEPGMFRREAHRRIAEAVWSLHAEGKRVDEGTVFDRLVGAGHMDLIGGAAGLADVLLAWDFDTRAVDELLELERRRQVWQACHDGTVKVANPDAEPDDVAADVAAALHAREAFDETGPITTDELLAMEAPDWLVEGILPAGLSMIFGAPKTGKSYIALQTAWSFATGTRWFRRACRDEPGQVLYLAGEGVADLRLRVEALVDETDKHPGGNIRWWTEPLSLSKERDAAKLRLAVEQTGAELVIVDTWRRFSGLVDENDAGKASQAIGALEDLTRKGTSVLVVHHTNAEGGIRGSTAVAGAVEAAARTILDPDAGRVTLTSYLARRGVGFSDIDLGWKRSGPDSVLREVG
jgi:hypothetical protein